MLVQTLESSKRRCRRRYDLAVTFTATVFVTVISTLRDAPPAIAATQGNVEREAEAALRTLDARIERDGNEVIYVSLKSNRQVTDADLAYLTKLKWKKTSTEVEFPTLYGIDGPSLAPAVVLTDTESPTLGWHT